MKKYITYILFFILVIGGSSSVKANSLDKVFNKGKELVSNVKLNKKTIEPFLEANNIFIKFNDKTFEYSFQNNGVVTIYDKSNITDKASWKFAGFFQNALKITYKNDESTFFLFYKGFEKISRVKNLSKINDDQTDFAIEHLTKKNANDQRIADKKRIEDEKIAKAKAKKLKAKAKKLEEERKLALKQREEKQENLKDKKQEYLKLKSEFNDQCKERFFGTSGYKEDSAEYIDCIYRETDKKKEQDKLIAEQIKAREENKKKISSTKVNKNLASKNEIKKIAKNSTPATNIQVAQKIKDEVAEIEKKISRLQKEILDIEKLNYDNMGRGIGDSRSEWMEINELKRINREILKLRGRKLELINRSKAKTSDYRIAKKQKPKNINSNKSEPIVVVYDAKVINADRIGDIQIPKFIQNKKVDKIVDEDLEELQKNYSQVLVLVKKEFLANSVNVGKETVQSEYLAGTRSVPNPEYRRVNSRISQLQNYKVDCQNRIYGLQRQANRDCTYACSDPLNPGPCWGCTGGKLSASVAIGDLNSGVSKANREISKLNDLLARTEVTLLEDIYKPYNYKLNLIEATKSAYYDFYLIKENESYFSKVKIEDKKTFKIPSELAKQDKDQNVYTRYNTLDDVKFWEDSPMKEIKYTDLFNEFKKNQKPIELKKIYASLNVEETGFFAKLFAPKKVTQDNNFKRIQDNNVDKRFFNVVIVKTFDGMGSGFYIKPNQIITNFHVIDGAKNITITDYFGKQSSAKIIKIDARRDLALLETNLKGTPVRFFRSKINSGMKVDAIGHPRGLDYSLTSGVISSVRMYASTYNVTRNANTKFIQTDVAINSGNSGGPLFHNQWVVGVNTQGLRKSKNEGLNFSVHLDELLDFINQ
jgi:S1-C subfamily serine protease